MVDETGDFKIQRHGTLEPVRYEDFDPLPDLDDDLDPDFEMEELWEWVFSMWCSRDLCGIL
jgi:hypothetical protein